MYVYSGGTVNSTTLNAGGRISFGNGVTANDITVNSDARMYISSGGTANGIVANGGSVYVNSGGVLTGSQTLGSGASVYVQAGGVLTGSRTLAPGANVYVESGSVVDLDISGRGPSGAALINDLSVIRGTPEFHVTVAADQTSGSYRLADGAANFDRTITVVTMDGDSVGSLTVGSSLKNGGATYELSVADGSLFLKVTGSVTVNMPKVLTVTADVTAPTNQNVTVTATFSADSVTRQYSFDNKSWQSYTSGVVVNENGTVYFRAGDGKGKYSTVKSYEVANIDTMAPEKPVASADITAPTSGRVTVAATFSGDSVEKQYSLDNKTWKTYTSGVVMSANGTVYFRGIDAAGNVSEVTGYAVANIVGGDVIPPAAPTVAASTAAPTNQNVTITATFSADSAQKQYSIDGKTWKDYTAALTVDANGTYYFRGIDAAGNVSEVTSCTVSNIDKVAPAAPTAKASTTVPTEQNVTVTATFSADSAQKQYSLDNKTWKTYTSGVVMTANGTVYFRGIDAVGNISEVASCNVANIYKAPTVPKVAADITSPTNQNVTITATFGDESVLKQFSTNNKSWKKYTKSITVKKNGTYYFRGVDATGNASKITTITVDNIDKKAPIAPTVAASTTAPTNKNVTITANFSADTATKQYSTDKKTWQTCTGSLTVDTNGTYYFRGIDAAGNISKVKNIKIKNIDKIAPAAPTVRTNPAKVTDKAVTLKIKFDKGSKVKEYSADGKNWIVCANSLKVGSNGTYYFRSTDAAGNVSQVASAAVTNIADTSNNAWEGATRLTGTILGALDVKVDPVDCYDVGSVSKLMLDLETGNAKVTFCGSDKQAVSTKVRCADGSERTLSSFDLVAGNSVNDNITLSSVGDAVKYLRIESAASATYRLAKLA